MSCVKPENYLVIWTKPIPPSQLLPYLPTTCTTHSFWDWLFCCEWLVFVYVCEACPLGVWGWSIPCVTVKGLACLLDVWGWSIWPVRLVSWMCEAGPLAETSTSCVWGWSMCARLVVYWVCEAGLLLCEAGLLGVWGWSIVCVWLVNWMDEAGSCVWCWSMCVRLVLVMWGWSTVLVRLVHALCEVALGCVRLV